MTSEQAQEWFTKELVYRGRHNGETIRADAEKCEWDLYEEWVSQCAPPNRDYCDAGIEDILCDAANKGLVPEGVYLILSAW